MKKKVAVIVLAVIMAFSCSFGLTACGGNGEGGEHTHTYSQQWTSDETNHWHVCTECGEAEEKSPHKFGENNICEICGYERQQEEHVHAKPGDADYVITESTHGYTCSCGVVITEEHTFGADGKCTECGYEAHEHSRPDNATLTPSDTGHSYTCSCGETVEEVHNFDTENVCKVCGYALNPSEGLAFAEKDGEYTLEGIGTFSGTELRIPYYYDGNPVTEIAEQAFYQNASLTSVLIPDSVSAIGASAFEDCTALTAVTLGAGLSSLKDNIFKDCFALESVKISENCTTLGNHVQASSNPGQYMFRNCKALKSVDFPASLTGIGNYAFWNCTSLEKMTGGEGLRYVGREIAGYTPFAQNDENYENGVLYVGASAIDAKDDISTVTLRNGTVSVARSAFWNNENLSSAVLPEGVAVLGYYAFYNCPALAEISLPSTLATVYYYVFDESVNIKTVRYAGGLHGWHSIKWYDEPAFGYELYLGGKPAEILYTPTAEGHGYVCDTCGETISEEHVFGDDSVCIVCGYAWDKEANGSQGLIFELNDDEESYSLVGFGNCTDKDVVIPSAYRGKPVTKIGDGGSIFSSGREARIESITIPDSVTAIGSYAFDTYDYTITELVVPNTVTELASSAFAGASVGELTFEEGSAITQIPGWCFFDIKCETLYLPDSAEEFASMSFHYAEIENLYIGKNLRNYYIGTPLSETFGFADVKNTVIDEENPYFVSKGNCIIRKESKILYTAFNNSVIPGDGSVEEIGAYAFQDLQIESVTIPSSVKIIGKRAFGHSGLYKDDVSPLKEVAFETENGQGVQIISYRAFENCELLKTVTLPDTLLTIGEEAFLNCGIESIAIPASVNAIYKGAFKDCPIMTAGRDDASVMEFKTPLGGWQNCDLKADDDGVLTEVVPSASVIEDIQEDWNYYLRQGRDAVIRDIELFKTTYDPDQQV